MVRFRIDKVDESTWMMRNIQISDKNKLELLSLNEAMCSVVHRWYLVSGEKAPKNIEYCKYYSGQDTIPDCLKNTNAGKFWFGEMKFIKGGIDMDGKIMPITA